MQMKRRARLSDSESQGSHSGQETEYGAEPRALRDGPGPTGVSEGGLDGVSEPSCRPHSGILAWGRLPGGQDAVALSSGLWTMMDVMGRGERGSEWAQGLGGRVCDEF